MTEITEFKCLEEKFKHGSHVFRAGNTYQLEDYPDISKAELKMFFDAGWISVDVWGEAPARDPSKKITLQVDNIATGVTSTEV